jgi:cytochrome c-type biogenesis protein CcmH/NrfG
MKVKKKIRMMMSRIGLVTYLNRVTLALSILVNVLLGGHSYQTIGARNLQRMRDNKLNLVWLLDFIYGDCHSLNLWIDWRARR